MTAAPRVVCIGIATVDAIVSVERLPGSDERVPAHDGRLAGGGVAATAAVTLARLGVPTAFVGRVADDDAGRWIRDDLARDGVDIEGLRLAGGRSPVSIVLVEHDSARRSLAPYLGDAGPIELTGSDLERCRAADWIHLDQLGVAVLPALAAAGVTTLVSVDDGVGIPDLALDRVALYAPTERVLRARFPAPSLDDALELALAAGPRLVVATRDAAGSAAAERLAADEVRHHRAPAHEIAGGSTLGAGDVFHGALLAALVERRPVDEALRRANGVAALACRGLDGRSTIPTRSELDAWLTTDPPIHHPETPHAHA